ncbi:DUF2663 family protein [Terrilactibacillus sp. S3-3]|nr:DUF2663 family protein [Terrilactibacillus sp. S3-3]
MVHLTLEELRDNDQITNMMYDILVQLIERRELEKSCKRRRMQCGLLFIASVAGFVLYVCFVKLPHIAQVYHFKQIAADPVIWFFGGMSIVMAIIWIDIKAKYDEADDDYDDLRKEVIDRADELWYQELNRSRRYETLQFLLKEKGINLFYK